MLLFKSLLRNLHVDRIYNSANYMYTHIPTVIKKSQDKNKTTSFCDMSKIEIIISKSAIGVTATTSKFTVNYF